MLIGISLCSRKKQNTWFLLTYLTLQTSTLEVCLLSLSQDKSSNQANLWLVSWVEWLSVLLIRIWMHAHRISCIKTSLETLAQLKTQMYQSVLVLGQALSTIFLWFQVKLKSINYICLVAILTLVRVHSLCPTLVIGIGAITRKCWMLLKPSMTRTVSSRATTVWVVHLKHSSRWYSLQPLSSSS